MKMSVEETLQGLGLSLPEPARPLASYVPAVQTGNLVYTSGQLPTQSGELRWRGSVGDEVTPDDAYQASRVAVLNALAAIKSVVGDLDRVRRVVRVTGYVASAAGFTDQPSVINGASDLLLELFGEAGKHSRAAIGVYQLPRDAPVEIDLIVEVE
jgi:enamine deaminase RidA (YjgF/YER057c/UK114 family)